MALASFRVKIPDGMGEDPAALRSLAEYAADLFCEREGVTRSGPVDHQVVHPLFRDEVLADGTVLHLRPELVGSFDAA